MIPTSAKPSVSNTGARPAGASAHIFNGQIASFIAAVAVCAIALMGVVGYSVQQQDALAVKYQRHLLTSVLASHSRILSNAVTEYSWWDEAVTNLTIKFDRDWADANIGRYLYETEEISASFVLDGNNQTVYAAVEGKRVDADALTYLGASLAQYADTARSAPRAAPTSVIGYAATDHGVFRVAAAVVTPYTNPKLIPTGMARSVLVMARLITKDGLVRVSKDYMIPELRLLERPAKAKSPTIVLMDIDDAQIAELTWTPSAPGREIWGTIAPALAGVVIVWIVLGVWFIRRTRAGMAYIVARNVDLRFKALELEAAVELAEAANRAKSDFISRVSHEFRTPLNVIVGYPALLLKDEGGAYSDHHRDGLSEVLKAGKHLAKLVDDVLELSRIDRGEAEFQIEKADPRTSIDGVLQSMREAASEGLPSIRDLTRSENLPQIEVDRTRFAQVLTILFSNAINYSDGDDPAVVLSCKIDLGRLRLLVTNPNAKIADAAFAKIFDPYVVLEGVDHQASRIGLSLVIAKQLVEGMGGRIGATATEGVGTTFWIDFAVVA